MGPYFKDRILYSENIEPSEYDILVSTDMYSLIKGYKEKANQDFITNSNIILGSLLNNKSYKGKYTIGNFKIYVNKLKDINKNYLDNKQYLFDTGEFLFK